jgi:tetratricopeptide (TPR) repeat protein
MAAVLLAASACAPSLQASNGPMDDLSVDPVRMATADEVGPSPGADFLIGQFAMEVGDIVQASDALQRALAADPDDLELRRQVFFLNVARGMRPAAVNQAKAVVELDPAADEPRLALFVDALQANRLDEARRQLDAMPERSVAALVSPLLRAWLSVAQGDPAAGLRAMPPPNPEDPLFAVLVYHRAALHALAGTPAAGLPELRTLVLRDEGAPVRATLLAVRLVFQLEGQASAQALLMEASARGQQPALVRAAAQALASGHAPEAGLDTAGEGVADTLLAISEALRQQNAGGRAIVYARLASWAAPADGEVTLTVADLLVGQDNPDLALEVLRGLPADSPWGWEGQLAMADALVAAERPGQAEQLLTQMAAERPERIDALVKLGDFARRTEDYPAAVEAYDQALQRAGAPSRGQWRLFYARGVARERTGDWDGAAADLQQALQLEPDQPQVLNYLGYSWVDRGENLEVALEMLQKAVELRPRDGFIVDSLGWAYFKVGRYDDAVAWLERAVEAEPGDPVINDHLGDAYWRVGRMREARFQWQRALTLGPDETVERQVQDKLAKGLPS